MNTTISDALGRGLSSLRVSVTDRCNLRCAYCMPEEAYTWLPSPSILSFEEISALVDALIPLGLRKVRLTGGEPLVRRELPRLVTLLAKKALDELSLTTNGVLLARQASALADAGLERITVSLDTLSRSRFLALSRRDRLEQVLAGLEAARRAGLAIKLDTVLLAGINDDEAVPLLDYAGKLGAELRFIEYMDVGGATAWSPARVVSRVELLRRLTATFGAITPVGERGSAPAERFRLPDGRIFGVIASTTQPFCKACDRARLTADGQLLTCLYAKSGFDLKRALRAGEPIAPIVERIWTERRDRGAEVRAALRDRGPLASAADLKGDTHLEMHTRGG